MPPNEDVSGDSTKQTPIVQIYEQINALFGNGKNDIFQMEFPCRLLEQGNYQYEGSDSIDAQQLKPPAVAEAEFRLTNDMFDISNMIGGPNGNKLSDQYRELVFSMIPTTSDSATSSEVDLKVDQAKICAWLEEEVDNIDPPSTDLLKGIPKDLGLRTPQQYKDEVPHTVKALRDAATTKKIPRVDLYQKLLDVYNSEKSRWLQFKIDARPKDFTNRSEVDAYDRLLTTYAPVIDAKLEALWTLLVVRGMYHKVRRYVGYVDIESASEVLLRAKESLRASVSRSIDDAEDIYPVVLTPANWAKHLSTNFKPEDLLNDASIMRNQLFDAEKTRATLLRRINVLKAGKQDLTKLQAIEDNARKDMTEAQNKMTVGYGDTVINLAQLYFDAALKGSENPADAIKEISSDKVSELNSTLMGRKLSPLSPEQFTKLRDMQQACLQRQASLNLASEAYIRARSASEQAKTENGGHLLDELQDQVDSLTMDIEYYQKVLATSLNPLADKITNVSTKATVDPAGATTPPTDVQIPPQTGQGASTWQEIVVTYTANASADSSMSSSSVSHESWQTGLWFFSAGGSKDSSSSSSSKKHSTSNTDIKIGFRVMKVSINRPWMNTALLGQTKDFWRLTTSKISMEKPADVKKALDSRSPDVPSSEECIMPSWATSFVVAKDIHLIFSSNEELDSSFVSNVQTSSNSSGGFLCFSTSKAESSTDHRDGASVIATSKSLSVKIPAPQILGWICELAPEDQTAETYVKFSADEFPPAAKPGEDSPVVRGAALPPSPPATPPVLAQS